MCVCKICDRNVKDSSNAMSLHIRTHNVTKQDYYTAFIDSRTTCIGCGVPVSFINLNNGFKEFCVKCTKENYNKKIDEYWKSESGQERKSINKTRLSITPMIGGRQKGVRNKQKYPITDAVVKRFEAQKGRPTPHNREPSKIAKCKDTWKNKLPSEFLDIRRKHQDTFIKNIKMCAEIPMLEQQRTNDALSKFFDISDEFSDTYDIDIAASEFQRLI